MRARRIEAILIYLEVTVTLPTTALVGRTARLCGAGLCSSVKEPSASALPGCNGGVRRVPLVK